MSDPWPDRDDDDHWLTVDTEGSMGTGPSVAAILESVAETLREAPDGARFDFELVVEEYAFGEEGTDE